MKEKHVVAIDPGTEQSAFVKLDIENMFISEMGIYENEFLLKEFIYGWQLINNNTSFYIEYPQPRGQPMYTQLVDTIRWIGRFEEALRRFDKPVEFIDRKDVKLYLCATTKANDSQIRAAILSRYDNIRPGGGKIPQIGIKRCPGPLYGVKKDIWAALAVALYARSLKL